MATKNAIDSSFPIEVAAGGTGVATLTDHGVLVGSGTGAVTALGSATNGQLIIGSTGADPVLASLTSTGGSITITPGAGTINLEAGAPALGVAFRAKLNTGVTDVTGNGAQYTIIFDTEDFDIGSDYNNSTGVFTAPTTGRYLFIGSVRINNAAGSTQMEIFFTINSSNFDVVMLNPTNVIKSGSYGVYDFSYFVNMTASDTIKVVVYATGGSGNTNDISGTSTFATFFSGYFVG